MRDDPDPTTAIDRAYAVLLAALADAGGARRPQEAPHEHLHRVLGPLGVRPAPTHLLADLFVLARFSPHAVTDVHRQDATRALEAALADLRANVVAKVEPMRERDRTERDSAARRAGEIALGAVVVVGGGIALYPQHAVSLLAVLAATVAAVVAGAMVVDASDERGGVSSVFERIRQPIEPRNDPPGLATIRDSFNRPIPPDQVVPGRTRLRLARVAAPILARHQIDVTRPEHVAAAGRLLSTTTVSAIAPPAKPRPDAPNQPGNPAQTAAIVEQVLDELDAPRAGAR